MLPLSPTAQRYIRNELFRRIGLTEAGRTRADALLFYGDPESSPPGKALVVRAAHPEAAVDLLKLRPASLRWLPPHAVLPDGSRARLSASTPILLWGSGTDAPATPFVERRDDGTVIINADLFAASFFMLSRWEEMVSSECDQHGRFPASASVALKQNFLDHPIVDEYALIVSCWLETVAPFLEKTEPRPSIHLSHDVDALGDSFIPNPAPLVSFYHPLAVRRALKAVRILPYVAGLRQEPLVKALCYLVSLSKRHRLHSVFNLMAAIPGPHDNGYDLNAPGTRKLLQFLLDEGMEIGFHPGYSTAVDPLRFTRELETFRSVVGPGSYGGRQHYLRFKAGETLNRWEAGGLAYDSTLGYPDHEGFRAGTCWRFRPFDVAADRELQLWEEPLIVMDATLLHYRSLRPEEGRQRILRFAEIARNVKGTFTLLWHNSSFSGIWKPWGKMYAEVLPLLSEMFSRKDPLG